MAQKNIVSAQVVRKGVFSVSDFYFEIYKFITDKLGYSFSEDDYSQWNEDYGTNIEFHWTFNRKQDDYVHFRIWVECKVRGMNKVKANIGGKARETNKAELEFNVKAVLITDPGDKWAKHPILKHFQSVYENFIFKSQLDQYITRLWEHLFNVENEVKAFFELPKF